MNDPISVNDTIISLSAQMGESGLWQVLFGVILSLKELNN